MKTVEYTKKVFLVVPVYNVEKYLDRCVDSLIRQSYAHTTIVLVNDGSTDTSGELCKSIVAAHPEILFVDKPNGGLSDARNAGLDKCFEQDGIEDAYVSFIDSDDFVSPDYVTRLVEIAERYQAGVVQCRYEKGDADAFTPTDEVPNVKAVSAKDALLGYDLKSMMNVKLFKLSLFDDLRFRKGVLNEDEFIIYQAVYAAEKVAFTDERLYYYYQRPGSIMDTIGKRLKNNAHRNDWLMAYTERHAFFTERGEQELALRTLEKVCTDIILRYTEQMSLPKNDRDTAVTGGKYVRTYRFFYKQMIRRKKMPLKRKMMFTAFYLCPMSSVIASKFTDLRK